MKKIILILIFLSSCNTSPEQKAEKLIEEYLRKSLNDYKSYEPVEFSSLDTIFSSLDTWKPYDSIARLRDAADVIAKTFKQENEKYFYNKPKLANSFLQDALKEEDTVRTMTNLLDSMNRKFFPKRIGWKMTHTLRAKNAFGAVVLNKITYFFDENLTRVIKEVDSSDLNTN